MRDRKKTQPKRVKSPDKGIMDSYSPCKSVGRVLPTSTKKTVNVFDSYRPKKDCVDYTISETFTKFQSGDIKVNVRQTAATYKDIPEEICKKKKKVKHFSGGPPQWKFIDELWRERRDEILVQIKADNKRLLRQKKLLNQQKFNDAHRKIQELCGPEWYMELSPNQLKCINKLQESVRKDIKNQTIDNTQDVLVEFGLVMRSWNNNIPIALMHSCGCPVEFLLVLYQIINPKRTHYSLNDRLLLSAVVHLCITQTLRELHVRIPSPPRIKQNVEKSIKKNVKVRHKSPYLEPLTFNPPPPKHSGLYKNNHKQRPESPYFSYLYYYELDKIQNKFCFNSSLFSEDLETRTRIQEYQLAQEFYTGFEGVQEQMLSLIPPSTLFECPNMLRRRSSSADSKLVLPPLCTVWDSEPEICFCGEKTNEGLKEPMRSDCEKRAEKYMQSICCCDDCIDDITKKNLIRISGGVQSDSIPIVGGTLLSKTCQCYIDYRNVIVASAAKQRLQDQDLKFVISGITMTKIGPIYNIGNALGNKICLCDEIKARKQQLKLAKEKLLTNEAKFVHGGVVMTQNGPVYVLSNIVARKPCKCLLIYYDQLEVLSKQNEIRKSPTTFVNSGLVNTELGPVFYFMGILDESIYKKAYNLDEADICSCIIEKPKCFTRCQKYFEYEQISSSSEGSPCASDSYYSSQSDTSSSTDEEACPYCKNFMVNMDSIQSSCSDNKTSESESSESESSESPESSESSESSSDLSAICEIEKVASKTSLSSKNERDKENISLEADKAFSTSCKCKDELEVFMKSKCPCEECNQKIRQSYATYIISGTKSTRSGNKVNIVQGIHQPLCNCLQEYLENIKRVDEYKSRIMARYNLRKQKNKYSIAGVASTATGPVYIISGVRPPVECECARALREKEEKTNYERQRAKMPETGRIKYEIQGVRAMPDENVYIISRALNIAKCKCEELLKNFEDAHKSCMEEFEAYLKQTEQETDDFITDISPDCGIYNRKKCYENENKRIVKHEKSSCCKKSNIPKTEDKKEKSPCCRKNDVPKTEIKTPSNKAKNRFTVASIIDTSSSTSESEEDDSSSEETESDISSCGSCHVELPPQVKPIQLESGEKYPEFFISKRFAIFRTFPKKYKKQNEILVHILKGMAEDGFPLAKLPQVHKLPIFKLWLQMRSGIYWTYEDRLKYQLKSQTLWRHTFSCFQQPPLVSMPFPNHISQNMTWQQAKLIKNVAAHQMQKYYRNDKHATIETCREFFATTFSYNFPTPAWKDCFFAYSPSKENEIFPYKIYQPHDVRIIPDNKKTHCYC